MAAARQLDVSGGVELERAVSNAAIKCEVSGGGVHFDPAWGDNNIKGIFFTVKIIKL
jgi:hypothetical protein